MSNERVESIITDMTAAIHELCKNPFGHAEEIVMLAREVIALSPPRPSLAEGSALFWSLSDEQKKHTLKYMRTLAMLQNI